MPLDPILVPILNAVPPLPATIDDIDAYRAEEAAGAAASVDDLMEPAPEGATRRVVQIPVDGSEVELHIFTPNTTGPHPGHLYVHGGGWIGGTIHDKGIDILCTERAVHADCVVVTVEYRKAPEHQFPVGLNDAYAALVWMDENAEKLGIRRDVLTIGGGSAGANIAAGIALKARDEQGPQLVFQILDVPALDLTMQAASFERNATGYGITTAYAQAVRDLYLADPDDARNPYASPLLADDLTGLPEAYLLPAEYDPLCDDAAAYAARLEEADVPVTLSLQKGQWHGSSLMTKILPAGRAWRDEQLAALRAVHTAHSTPVS
jgi:acetyl esterase